jgi:hypothetical protein
LEGNVVVATPFVVVVRVSGRAAATVTTVAVATWRS